MNNIRSRQFDRVANEMEVLEHAQLNITRLAMVSAFQASDDDVAKMIFLLVRQRIQNKDKLTMEDYVGDIEVLREIAMLSGQKQVTRDILTLIDFFNNNESYVETVLSHKRRQLIFDGLRDNYRNN
jgi:hypothetical protein